MVWAFSCPRLLAARRASSLSRAAFAFFSAASTRSSSADFAMLTCLLVKREPWHWHPLPARAARILVLLFYGPPSLKPRRRGEGRVGGENLLRAGTVERNVPGEGVREVILGRLGELDELPGQVAPVTGQR